jgi:hypothetical protein
MTTDGKDQLLELLTESHSATQKTLQGVDYQLRVYPPDGWMVRDVIGHIAVWDRESAKSLRAFRAGGDYSIPHLEEHAFNEKQRAKQQSLTDQQIEQEWEGARQEFIAAVDDIPLDKFPGDLLYPWGDERGTIAQLVRYMVEHDEEHRQEIIKASETSSEG